jgi:hypothetical protein
MLVKQSEVKKIVKAAGKRTGKDFLEAFERYVAQRLEQAVKEHNGGKLTLDAATAAFVFGKKTI